MFEMIAQSKFLIFPFQHLVMRKMTWPPAKPWKFVLFSSIIIYNHLSTNWPQFLFFLSHITSISHWLRKNILSIFISTEISCVIYWHKYCSWLAVITDAFHTSACKRSRDIFLWNSTTRARIVYINKDQWKLSIASLMINFENVVRAKTLTYHILRPEETVGMPRWLYPAVLPVPYRNLISKRQDIIYYLSFAKWIKINLNCKSLFCY